VVVELEGRMNAEVRQQEKTEERNFRRESYQENI